MAKNSPIIVILAALIGNALIACLKFVAAWMTLSSAMFSEAIHSVVDTCNQALLLLGIRLSKRPPNKNHPFGHGKEIYFWSFVVAILLFSLGGGISIYKGVIHLLHPVPLKNITVNYIVLSIASVIEFFAWFLAFTSIKGKSKNFNFIKSIQDSKDPSLIVVLLEDSAALLGLLLAIVGIACSVYFDEPRFDATASIAIGLMLFGVAIWMAYESKLLLIGEAASPETVEMIKKIITQDKNVNDVKNILTMHMGPNEILVNLYVDFHDGISSSEVEKSISSVEDKIKEAYPVAKWIFIAAKSFSDKKG